MPIKAVRPCLSGAARLATILLITFLFVLPACVAAHVELKGRREYENVKEDFMCRACVGLGEVLFDEVLTSIADRYQAPPFAAPLGSASSPAKASDSSTQLRQASGVGSRQREQLIVEVHEAIDALCESLENSIRRQSMEAATEAADDVVARQLLNPLVSSTDLRDGVIAVCPAALEEMNEALADTAFKHLLTEKVLLSTPSSKRENKRTGQSSSEVLEAEAPIYHLPAAGTFCEDLGLCSSYVHYHITSDAAVRRRAREARAANAATIMLDGSDPSPVSSANGKRKGNAGNRQATGDRTPQQKASTKKTSHYHVGSADDLSLGETLRRVFQLDTWRQLADSLNTTEVSSISFWARGLALVVGSDVRFHLRAYVPFVVVYFLGMVAVLLLVVAVAGACRSLRTAEGEKSARTDATRGRKPGDPEKKAQ
ncbi:hypothetical protein ABL78_6135 [Leptomonas seymouri]|uniref:Transmembrane protein n=1 Tax=Leptomonas seymouri TaxID=5684 RepID=A0A0N0P4G6_LEPSE|nr:hypothetical protein ABL78_6135 [Leptomonas seymouri]|eukprot:KPI84807.1 hypothetical protein ABL78_6135 [Leptomonas seymouri]